VFLFSCFFVILVLQIKLNEVIHWQMAKIQYVQGVILSQLTFSM